MTNSIIEKPIVTGTVSPKKNSFDFSNYLAPIEDVQNCDSDFLPPKSDTTPLEIVPLENEGDAKNGHGNQLIIEIEDKKDNVKELNSQEIVEQNTAKNIWHFLYN